jgi:hypothetical protein
MGHLAEMALATLDSAPIPETMPLSKLSLTTIAPNFPQPPLPKSDAFPCVIKAEELPSLSLPSLFMALRQFGPIYTLKDGTPIGCIMQYFERADSLAAQNGEISIEGRKIILRAYDPVVVFCNVRLVSFEL